MMEPAHGTRLTKLASAAFKHSILTLFSGWLLTMPLVMHGAEMNEQNRLHLYVVFNNLPYKKGLTTSWGFACVLKGLDQTILFDTGREGDILLSNMEQLGLAPDDVDVVVLSHIDADHTGGLTAFLSRHNAVTIFIPDSFPVAYRNEISHYGAAVQTVTGPRPLFDGVHTTGEMGDAIREQALLVETSRGLVMITGCAHPNVADMAERATEYLGKPITLLVGGFHLGGSSESAIRVIIRRLKALGVQQVAPSHCTGDTAMGMFREAWDDNFIEGGLGAHIILPQ